MSDAATPTLELRDVVRAYRTDADPLTVLSNTNCAIAPGEAVGLVAPSGTGKSTLLHLAGLLEFPTEGDVLVEGQSTNKLDDKGRTSIRRDKLGFVYQFHHLLPEFTALENVALPIMVAGGSARAAKVKATEILERVGLGHRLSHRPAKLSGGEQQRVAVARALANDPVLLLADEPTGNLDPTTSETVFSLLLDMVRERGMSAMIATHNIELAGRLDRVLTLQDGSIVPYAG